VRDAYGNSYGSMAHSAATGAVGSAGVALPGSSSSSSRQNKGSLDVDQLQDQLPLLVGGIEHCLRQVSADLPQQMSYALELLAVRQAANSATVAWCLAIL
jgi:hypothetical protein